MQYIVAALLLAPVIAHADNEIPLIVANNRQAWTFAVDPSQATARPTGSYKKKPDERWPAPVASAFRDKRDRSTYQEHAAQTWDLMDGPKWAAPSPDCETLSLGYGLTPLSVVTRVEYGNSKPWSRRGELQVQGSNFVADIQWSSDSRYLLVIESEGRDSISPVGLVGRFVGHPIPLRTFYISSVDVQTGERKRLKLIAGVQHGTVAFAGTQTECEER